MSTSVCTHATLPAVSRLRDDVDKAAVSKEISEGLRAMAKQIPELKAFSCGADAGLDPARNHDFAIAADFADEAGYKAYAKHPLHLDVIGRLIKPALAAGGRVAVQFEVAGGAL